MDNHFVGAIYSVARPVVAGVLRLLDKNVPVQVIGSGSFTFEQILAGMQRTGPVVGNDVSLLTTSMADAILGRDRRVEVRTETFEWASKWLKGSPEQRAAAVLAVYTAGRFVRRRNLYEEHRWRQYMDDTEGLLEGSLEKVKALKDRVRLDDFLVEDGAALLGRRGWAYLVFPPTYPGGYDRLYEVLETHLSWDKPAFVDLADRYEDFCQQVAQQDLFLLGADRRLDLPHLRAFVKGPGKQRPFYIYSNIGLKKSVRLSKTVLEPPRVPYADDGMLFSDDTKIAIVETSKANMDYLRSVFLKKVPSGLGVSGMPGYNAFLVLADGRLIGGFAYGLTYTRRVAEAYLVVDFRIPDVCRIAKLIIMVARSREVKELLEASWRARIKVLSTTVFTDKPVSMKYRGVWSLRERLNGRVIYWTKFGERSLAEEYNLWLNKYYRRCAK